MDGLTGLPDRARGVEETDRLIGQLRTAGQPLCVMWIGLDRFRDINAAFGHRQGDRVLQTLARRLAHGLGRRGTLARMAGDEFAILLPGADLFAAEVLGESMLRLLALPLEVAGVSIRPACSIGLAAMTATDGPVELLERADLAMHVAKRGGGMHCAVAGHGRSEPAGPSPLLREELEIEALLHEAVDTGGLALHFQPIVRTADGRLDALEALMRCRVGERHLPPGQFIPVAEKSGLIVRLGEWSLLEAAQLAQRLNAAGQTARIAVNLSRVQLTAPRFQQVLHAALACSDLPAEQIELELTESLFMDASRTVRANLDAAREAGFRLSIDDFGTGYSCLAYLKDLPAHKIKLDRAFVCGLPEDRKSLAIVRLVTQLARDFGLEVIAEGVETAAQFDCLGEAGVDAIQGFLLSGPLSEHDLLDWMKERRPHGY